MLRIAVLGAGRIGQVHAANVAHSANATLIAVADPVGPAAAAVAEKFGCLAVENPYEALDRKDVDVVVVGTPTDTHIELTLAALSRGKAVLCEKPLGLDFEQSRAALEAMEASSVPVMLGFNRRFDPSAAELKRAIVAGEIGGVRQLIITSRDPSPPPAEYIARSGGIFRDMLIHDFDMARWLLGEEPVEVFATASCLVDPAIRALGDFDTTMVILTTASGAQCHINTSRQSVYGHDQRLEVIGSTGMLSNGHMRPHSVERYTSTTTGAKARLVDFFIDRYAEAYRRELEAFIAAVVSGAPCPVTPRDAQGAMAIAEGAISSVKTKQSVSLR